MPARDRRRRRPEREIGRDQHVGRRAAGLDGGAGRRRQRALARPARDADPGRAGADGQRLRGFDRTSLRDARSCAHRRGRPAVAVVRRPRRPVAVATNWGWPPTSIDRTRARPGLDAPEPAVLWRRDPDRAAADGDARTGSRCRSGSLGDAVRARVDPRHVVMRPVEEPDALGARRERAHATACRSSPRSAGPRIDAVDRVVARPPTPPPAPDRHPREALARRGRRARLARQLDGARDLRLSRIDARDAGRASRRSSRCRPRCRPRRARRRRRDRSAAGRPRTASRPLRLRDRARTTVSASLSSTQTAPSPTAMLLGAVAASVKDPMPPSASSATTKLPRRRPRASPVVSATVAATAREHDQPGGEDAPAAAPIQRARCAHPAGARAPSISSPQLRSDPSGRARRPASNTRSSP